MIDANTSLNNLFIEACDIAENLVQSQEEFIVRDLFRGVEWNRIPKGYRTKLGGMFFDYANNQGKNIIDTLGKTPQNQHRYRKK